MSEVRAATNLPESWENAKAYASLIGEVPPAFASLAKGVTLDVARGSTEKLSDANRGQLERLLRSENFRASYYYAAKFCRADQITELNLSKLRDLSKLFPPVDVPFLLPVIFFFRKFHKRLKNEQWKDMLGPMTERIHTGMLVGASLDNVGVGVGAFAAAARYLGAACFILHDAEGFLPFQNKLARLDGDFDTAFEEERWGCTSLQTFAYLAQQFGFGGPFAENFVKALDPATEMSDIASREFYRFRVTNHWIDSIQATGDIPDMTHRGDFYPMEERMDVLRSSLQAMEKNLGGKSWLLRSTEDVSPEAAPELHKEGGTVAAKPAEESSAPGSESEESSDSEDEVF